MNLDTSAMEPKSNDSKNKYESLKYTIVARAGVLSNFLFSKYNKETYLIMSYFLFEVSQVLFPWQILEIIPLFLYLLLTNIFLSYFKKLFCYSLP